MNPRVNRSVLQLCAAVVLASCGAAAHGQVLADCHDDYSNVQGAGNWYYGFYNGDSDTPWSINDFELLPIFNGLFWTRPEGPGGYWTRVTRDGGHPNGTITSNDRVPEVNWAVRRWVSPGDYVVDITGRSWDAAPGPAGNGVVTHFIADGHELNSTIIENGNEHGVEFGMRMCVTRGTVLDFAIDPRDGNDLGDDTGCHIRIRTIIEHQPLGGFTCEGGTYFLEIVTIPGDFEYQWRFNGRPIEHEANSSVYRVINLTPDRVGVYDCVVTDACGSMVSEGATVAICRADYDCDGFIDSRDFFTFVTDFLTEAPRSDFNRDHVFNSQDFFDFTTIFFQPCIF